MDAGAYWYIKDAAFFLVVLHNKHIASQNVATVAYEK